MLNKVQLIGRLGADPELKYLQNGTPMCNFRVATDEYYNDKEGNRVQQTEWHRVTVFQRSAENCGRYLSKGSLVYVEGSLQTRKWQDQQGNDRYSTDIRAQKVQFLDRKGEGGGQGGQNWQGGQGGQNWQGGQGGQSGQGGGWQDGQGGGWPSEADSYGSESFPQQNQARQQSGGGSTGGGQVQDGSPFPSEASDMDKFPF